MSTPLYRHTPYSTLIQGVCQGKNYVAFVFCGLKASQANAWEAKEGGKKKESERGAH